jgi:hypothetical protein
MIQRRDRCQCGKRKDIRAYQCADCHWATTKVERMRAVRELAPVESFNPVRDVFEWLIEQSRGEIS